MLGNPQNNFKKNLLNSSDSHFRSFENEMLGLSEKVAKNENHEREKMIDYFGDFEKKFLEANLDKVISLQELHNIAETIGQRDWGYVKYILTIICLMLKSYQNISDNCNDDVLNQKTSSPVRPESSGMINKMKDMSLKDISVNSPASNGIIVPEKRKSFLNQAVVQKRPKQFNQSEINEQLMSLSNIFKKMKNIDVQMNISNCWNCQQKYCTRHHFQPGVDPVSGFEAINLVGRSHQNQSDSFIGDSSSFSIIPQEKENRR